MRIRFTLAAAMAFATLTLCTATTEAQQLSSVTVTATTPGSIVLGCGAAPPVYEPAQFVLTRTGEVTGSLTVSIAWSGAMTTAMTFSPTSATFAPGSSTATVTAESASAPQIAVGGRDLALTVTPGSGYQLGNPSSANTEINGPVHIFACLGPPPPPPPLLPPVQANPIFTG